MTPKNYLYISLLHVLGIKYILIIICNYFFYFSFISISLINLIKHLGKFFCARVQRVVCYEAKATISKNPFSSVARATISCKQVKILISVKMNMTSLQTLEYGNKRNRSNLSQIARFTKKGRGKSLSEALLFAEHGENMLCTKIVLNVRNNFCTQHVFPRFELGIFMY